MSTATTQLVELIARRLVQAHYPGDDHDRWTGLAEMTKGAYRKQAEYVIRAGLVLQPEAEDWKATAAEVLAEHAPSGARSCRCGWRGESLFLSAHQAEQLAAAGVLGAAA